MGRTGLIVAPRTDTYALDYAGRPRCRKQMCYTRAVREQRSYTDEDRAQVRALLVQGYGPRHIERDLNIPSSTIRGWHDNWPELPQERRAALDELTMANATAAQRIKAKHLEWLERDVQEGPLSNQAFMAVNASGGTDGDKLFKGREIDAKHPPDIHVQQAVFIIKKDD